MKASYSNFKVAALGSALALGGIAANAGESAPKEPVTPLTVEETSLCDTVFNALKYKPDNGPFDEVKFAFRYHGQYHWTDADQGSDNGYESRRIRFGPAFKMFDKKLAFKNEWNLDGLDNDGDDVAFSDIDELNLTYEFVEGHSITVGKIKQLLTREYHISSKQILTFERSALVNQLIPAKAWGAEYNGKADKLSYIVGAAAASFDGEYDEWFDTSGDYWYYGSLGYDLTGICPIGKDSANIMLDYAYTPEQGTASPGAEHVVSLNYDGSNGKFRLIWDILGGFGGGSDVYGAILMPSYMLTDKLEVVGRYQYADGDVSLQKRYEGTVVSNRDVTNYHALYAGVNYYICDHNLKLMAGVEYASGDSRDGSDGYDGVTFLTGVRLYF